MTARPLPITDEHACEVPASPDRVWDALERWTTRHLLRAAPRAFVWAWRLAPSSGFAAVETERPARLVFAGRHRFARYELVFELTGSGEGTTLCARTFAEFPGLLGRFYRAAVIGSGGHALVVRRMLRDVASQVVRS